MYRLTGKRTRRPSVHIPRQKAVIHGDGTRHCAQCGDYIDPKDWCLDCIKAGKPCRAPHTRLCKRADAAFCDGGCKAFHRSTYIRDCVPLRDGAGHGRA